MRGLQRMEGAKAAYINAYCNINTNVEDKVKVNILIDLASVCSEMPKSVCKYIRLFKHTIILMSVHIHLSIMCKFLSN